MYLGVGSPGLSLGACYCGGSREDVDLLGYVRPVVLITPEAAFGSSNDLLAAYAKTRKKKGNSRRGNSDAFRQLGNSEGSFQMRGCSERMNPPGIWRPSSSASSLIGYQSQKEAGKAINHKLPRLKSLSLVDPNLNLLFTRLSGRCAGVIWADWWLEGDVPADDHRVFVQPCAFRGSSRITRLHIAYKAPGCCR